MIRIETGDFRELSKSLADGSVDLVLTDPPYPREYLPLWADLGRIAARVLKPSGFLVAYSGQMYLPEIMGMLGQHLDWYWQMILLQPGSNTRVWGRAMRQAWKPILVYCKPPRKRRNAAGPDVLTSPNHSKQYHEWGQSLEPVRWLVERYSRKGDLVLDPLLGGGTTAVAAFQTGRDCIGHEINPVTADVARARLATAQLPLTIPGLTVLQEVMAL